MTLDGDTFAALWYASAWSSPYELGAAFDDGLHLERERGADDPFTRRWWQRRRKLTHGDVDRESGRLRQAERRARLDPAELRAAAAAHSRAYRRRRRQAAASTCEQCGRSLAELELRADARTCSSTCRDKRKKQRRKART